MNGWAKKGGGGLVWGHENVFICLGKREFMEYFSTAVMSTEKLMNIHVYRNQTTATQRRRNRTLHSPAIVFESRAPPTLAEI